MYLYVCLHVSERGFHKHTCQPLALPFSCFTLNCWTVARNDANVEVIKQVDNACLTLHISFIFHC